MVFFKFSWWHPKAKASPTPTPKPLFVLFTCGRWGIHLTIDHPFCDKQTWHESRVHPCSNSLKMASFTCFFVATLNKNSLICLKMGLLSCCFMAKFPTQNGGGRGGEGGGLFHLKKLSSKWNKYWTFNLEIGRTGLKPAQMQILKTSSFMNILGSLSFFGSYWFPPIKSMDKIQYPPIKFSPLVRPLVRSFWTEEYTTCTHFLLPRTTLFMWFFFLGQPPPQYSKSHPIYFTHRFIFYKFSVWKWTLLEHLPFNSMLKKKRNHFLLFFKK